MKNNFYYFLFLNQNPKNEENRRVTLEKSYL